ncbi:N-acetylmuramoyl-L-alanine amidase [Campylobacter volucris]|uniref:N-acetylmuramoyl-L-alanine amidase n=2 Tax=Campylobacter volucris TaxID=1031542 RepID=A0A5C7DV33_9BACT|nr:N-acetylmuramoyl-L-alanine amidase [Campylobacter volucris]TXE86421.1 N-acetylmuramoyl-L-alanine amidase [Campylobacter volucris]
MLKIFLVLILFFLNVFANTEVKKFDQVFLTSNPEEKLQFHQQLKSLYIQSVINDNEEEKKEILKRLIISSNFLGFDDKAYVQELIDGGVKEDEILKLKNALSVIKDQKVKKHENITSRLNTQDKKEDKNLPQAELFILEMKKIDNGVLLNLNRKINQKDIKNFTLKGENFRYVADFDGVLKGPKQNFKFKEFDIIVSQFNPQTMRLVLTSKKELKAKIELNDNTLFMGIDEEKKEKTQALLPKDTDDKKVVAKEKEDPLYVLKSSKDKNGVNLKLDNDIDLDDIKINSFKDGKVYRSIVSFEAILEGDRKKFDINNNQSITLVQYDKKTIRVVLTSSKEFKTNLDLDDDELFIGFTKNTAVKKKSNPSAKKTIKKSGKVIVIDAGHGGKDPGTLGDRGVKEKDVVLSVALKLGNELKKRGYKIYYTRSTDKFINLRDRTSMANDKMADLFISIHANAAPNKQRAKTLQGIETFFLSPARSERSKKAAELENQSDFEEMNYFSKQTFLNFLNREKIVASNKLAIDVQKSILSNVRKKYKVVDGGVREAPFWVLVGAQMPAILIEIGYISHPSERTRLVDRNFQDLLAIGIANGIESYFYKNQ